MLVERPRADKRLDLHSTLLPGAPKHAPPPRPDATHPLAGFYRPGSAPCRCSDCSGGELPAVASAGRYL
jgi:hypothetical protein